MTTAKEKKEIQKKIEGAIRRFPGLDYAGLVWDFSDKKYSREYRTEKFFQEQLTWPDTQRLLNAADEFIHACEWLGKQGKRKTINQCCSSYGMKHMAENAWKTGGDFGHGYISNGVLIAAAIHLGFEIRPVAGINNVRLNISLTKTEEDKAEIRATRAWCREQRRRTPRWAR